MSYNVELFFARNSFPFEEYEEFVSSSLFGQTDLRILEGQSLELGDGADRLHAFQVTVKEPDLLASSDDPCGVNVSFILYRNNQDEDREFNEFRFMLTVETGGSATLRSRMVQLSAVANGFDIFSERVVRDEQSTEELNAVAYLEKEAFLAHAGRTLSLWYGDDIGAAGVLDGRGHLIELSRQPP